MYVCLCKGITEKDLSKAQDKSRPRELCKRLGVGQECGLCLESAIKILQGPKNQEQQCTAETPSLTHNK